MYNEDTEELWEDFEVYVQKLKMIILKKHNKEPLTESDQFSKKEYSECLEMVYNMSFEHSDITIISKRLQEIFSDFIRQNIFRTLQKVQSNKELLLDELIKSWETYELLKKWISRFFHSYNKMTEVHHKKKIHSDTLAIEEFKKIVFIQFRFHIENSLMLLIEEIRGGEDVKLIAYKSNLRKVFGIFRDLFIEGTQDRTKIFFELKTKILEMTESYLNHKQNSWDVTDCSTYFSNVESLINFEEDFFNDILEGNNSLRFIGESVVQLLYEKLIDEYRHQFVQSELGIKHFIVTKDYDGLKRMTGQYSKYDNKFEVIKEGYRDVLVGLFQSFVDLLKEKINEEKIDMKKQELKKNNTMIQSLIEVYIEHNKIIKECLKNYYDFKVQQNKALEIVLNQKSNMFSIPLLQATFTNETLKKASKNTEEQDLINIFDGVVSFFSNLEEKDKFMMHFGRFLSKRLLDSDQESMNMLEWDRYLIQTIKSKLGSEITKNFESMINDVILWWENRQEFRDYLDKNYSKVVDNQNKPVDDQIKCVEPTVISNEMVNEIQQNSNDQNEPIQEKELVVETKSDEKEPNEITEQKTEPTQENAQVVETKEVEKIDHSSINVNVLAHCEFKIPTEIYLKPPTYIYNLQKTFEQFYKDQKYNFKKTIEWVYYYGTVDIKYNFGSGKSFFVLMKPYQYFVLELFNHQDELSYKEICDKLCCDKFSKEILNSILDSIVTGKFQIIKKKIEEPKEKTDNENSMQNEIVSEKTETKKAQDKGYSDSDVLILNKDFKSKQKRFVIRDAKFKAEVKEDESGLQAERKYAIESCLVRVMKCQKIYKYQDLINDTMKLLLKFSPEAKDIRSQIESLIKRDYFERDADEMNQLKYIA